MQAPSTSLQASWNMQQQLHAYRPGDSALQQAHHLHHHHAPSHHHHSAAANADKQHQEAAAVVAAAAAAGAYSNPPSPYDPYPGAASGLHHADPGAYAGKHILATEC